MELLNKLSENGRLSEAEFAELLRSCDETLATEAAAIARIKRKGTYGDRVFLRGLLEFSNYCRNDCYYCGLRKSYRGLSRYRMTKEEIISRTDYGYELGFRTFVLQSGEDAFFSDELLCGMIAEIKDRHPDCAVTLSIGERERESYERLFAAGADRYLLRHESCVKEHYVLLHPEEMSFEHRMGCLRMLREIGYQVGCGFMVGSPFQTSGHLAKELCFLAEFKPDMCGIGPFIPKEGTPFEEKKAGSVEMTCFLLSLIRIMLPDVLLPATTALGTLDPEGREKGIMAGANVLMPNLSPVSLRSLYALYDSKICMGEESAECVECLKRRIEKTGCRIEVSRGDHKQFTHGGGVGHFAGGG